MKLREKLILADFSVLLVSLGTKWSTIERRALQDSIILRNMGCNPVILCVKDSQIDKEADEEDIARVYVAKRASYYLGLKFIFELRKLIREGRFNIIHCYSLYATMTSAAVLGFNQEVPLFYTFNQAMRRVSHPILYGLLIKRVDYIFSLSSDVENGIKEIFPVPVKKVRTIGVGIDVVARSIELKNKKKTTIGCVLDSILCLNDLQFPIKAFRLLKDSSEGIWDSLELKLFLGPAVARSSQVKELLTELDYEFYQGDIHLIYLKGSHTALGEVDIFLSTAFDEPVNDYEIYALLHGIPLLFPRNFMRQFILQDYGPVGESYFYNDLREIRTKLLKILSHLEDYTYQLNIVFPELVARHGLDVYVSEFQKFYEMAFLKRLRLKYKKARNS